MFIYIYVTCLRSIGVLPVCLGIHQRGGAVGGWVQWMGVVLYNKTAYNIMYTTTPCFHCTPL